MMKLTDSESDFKKRLAGRSFLCARSLKRWGLTPNEAEGHFADKKEKSILDVPTESVQNTLAASNGGPCRARTSDPVIMSHLL